MFGIIAALVFATAFTLAIGTIVFMFAAYREKMVAALLFEPMPETAPVQPAAIHRRRPSVQQGYAMRRPRPLAVALAA